MEPIVSIIISTYNRGKCIRKAIESVLNQTHKDFELIIVDDASNDNTLEVISGFARKDHRIKIIANEINLGLAKSLNKGISSGYGKYIARLDDDDFWCYSDKLGRQIDFLEKNPDYVLVGGGVIRINEQGKEVMRFYLPENDKKIRQTILLGNPFAHSTVIFRKKIWEKARGYDETLVFAQDWDLWMRFGKLGKFYNFSEYFIHYLQSKKSISNSNSRRNIMINIKLIKKYRYDYPGFRKAILFHRIAYFYSFLPFNKKLWPMVFRLKKLYETK